MCRDQLINLIADKTGIRRRLVKEVLDAFQDLTTDSLSKGDQVVLSGFGTFALKSRSPRIGRNPHTGDPVEIPARVMPFFTPSETLKARISGESSAKKHAVKSPRTSPAK